MMLGVRLMLSVVMVCALAAMSSAETLTAGGIDMPPWSMEEGKDGAGINIDIFREAAKRSGYEMTYRLIPFKRKLVEFREQRIDVDPGTNPKWRSDDQEISVYSIPFYESANVVFIRKDSGISAKTVQDFRGKRIGCQAGYYYTDGFQEAFDSQEIIRDDANSHESNMKKLNAQRVDGIIIDKVTGLYLIRELGLNPEDFEVAYVFEAKSVLYMRIHKSKEHVIPKLNQALQEMKEDGIIEKIVEKYTQ